MKRLRTWLVNRHVKKMSKTFKKHDSLVLHYTDLLEKLENV